MLKVDFTKSKKLDNRGYTWLKNYALSKYTRLEDCYKDASEYKYRAYYDNIRLMQDLGGEDLKILSYNCSFFTVAFCVRSCSIQSFYFVVNTGQSLYVYDVDVYDLFCFLKRDGLADTECGGGCVCSNDLIFCCNNLFCLIFDNFRGFLTSYGLRDNDGVDVEYSTIGTYSECLYYAKAYNIDNYAIDRVTITDKYGNCDYDGSTY